jgi:hypothetical protein
MFHWLVAALEAAYVAFSEKAVSGVPDFCAL